MPTISATHCKHGHLMTPENTRFADKKRNCLRCHQETQRRYRERQDAGIAYEPAPAATRFLALVDKSPACWEWRGRRHRLGYGQFHHKTGACMVAHKFSWELRNGPVPDGLELDHLCRNRGCVNPDHLEAVTHAENVRRAWLARKAA